MSCGARFYDLGRDPIVCPKCGTLYQAVALPMGRVAAAAAAAAARRPAPVEEDEPEVATADVELVSLEDAEAAESGTDATTDDVIDIEDDAADDTFLEEEEEGDDDVSDLIDGDIEDDEEA
jgi:uncharacterized protein (TIGR02300 family)